MKKTIIVLACIGMLVGVTPCSLYSQTPSPDQWESFISTNNTTLVSDTFRMQRFEDSIQDNWPYTVEGSHSIVDASSAGLGQTDGAKLMKLELSSSLRFSTVASPLHQTIRGGLAFGVKNMMKGEHLNVVLREESKLDTVLLYNSKTDNYTTNVRHVDLYRTIYGIDFNVEKAAANTKNGYYCVDSVYLFGDIPSYSLFRGKSFWNDTTSWSHLPAERHRHALIKGQVSITSDIHCDQVSLNGKMIVEKNKTFSLGDLNIHEASSSFKNEGDLLLDGKVSLTRTFPEKGVWYFVSFPFDVYADGIDSGFALKDDSPNAGGNFIYVLSYNSETRSKGDGTQSNWVVLPESATRSNSPVFEKNKGYLLAIDEQADKTTICFTSRAGDVSSSFGKSGEINIDIPYAIDKNSANSGWYLCGNPLPSSLHVKELAHSSLDGYVYLFNGEDYTQIPLDGNYVLPPFAAFFLKADQTTTISVGVTGEDPKSIALSAMSPLRGIKSEPSVGVATNNIEVMENKFYRMEKNMFHITNAPENGTVAIVDGAGRQISVSKFASGESKQILLPKQSGFYVLIIQTQNGRGEYKFIR